MARSYGTGRTERVVLRVTEGEKRRLDTEAESAGLSLNEYGRAKLFSEGVTDVSGTYVLTNDVTPVLNDLQEALQRAKQALSGKE